MSKKIFMATLVALALAAPAMAFDVQIKGDFNNRFMYTTNSDASTLDVLSAEAARYVNVGLIGADPSLDNLIGLSDENDDSDDFFGEVKYRLIFNATDDEKKVKGTWAMEIGSEKFGADGAAFAGDQKEFELMWANIDFELPFDPATRAIIGLQPVKLNKWVWSDNAAGVKLASKRGALGYDLAWFRNDYDFGTQAGIRDVYALDVNYAGEGMPKLNAFAYYSHDLDLAVGGNDYTDTEIWLGAAIDGQAGPLFYGATGVYLTGDLEADTTGVKDFDRSAYLLHGEVTYKTGIARLKAGWLYASGDDDPTDGDVENYDVIDVYVPVGSVVIFDSYADDNTASRSPYIRDKGYSMPYLAADFDLSDKTSVGASWFWHTTAEDLEGINGVKEDEIGHEIAVRASTKVTKNLTAGIQAGYLIGGDGWDALSVTDDGDDMFRTDASIRLKF